MGVKITELPTTSVNEADYIPVANTTSGTRKVLMEDVLNQASPALDTALSPTSENAVQNKAVAAAVNTVSVGLANAQNDIDDLKSAFDLDSLTPDVKSALLNLLEHVAYIDEDGQDYYDDLYDALYNRYWQVTNNLTNCTTSNASEQTLKSGAYSATITAAAGYVMSGATVSITMGGNDITSTAYSNGVIFIPAVTGALVITISAAAKTVSSISAVYTQSGTVYTNDELDSLKDDLAVTATYTGGTTETIPATGYELSGTLAEGTQTITVTFGGKTDTFTVDCTVNGWLYHFEQSLASSGSEDFGFLGNCSYDTGHDGNGYSMYNDTQAAYASSFIPPDLSGDFTISFWTKTLNAAVGQGLSAYTGGASSSGLESLGIAENVKTGWSVASNGVDHSNNGLRMAHYTSGAISIRLVNSTSAKGKNYMCTPPSSFSSTTWHHFALTRKDGVIRFFVDGEVIFTVSVNDALRFPTQCAIGGYYDTSNTLLTPTGNKSWYDDLFVAEYCKWDGEFDPSAITY